ncbi:PREDICTED: placenta-specific protein 1 [Chrysochloris asiatica]|uniref:Placenta-specific protein 1 n=1 Tax=Chrysochloris asiatica TaxID=185453 RepID=A0A9B0TI25_CHRAS|nr:PREDICTED: placenta-specific protein 1 [Chrysochloris asiatica]
MKVSALVGGMFLLMSVIPSCSGQNPITVLCSTDWFMVTVHPFMLNSDVYVHFSKLYLGHGCPANHVQPHAYHFTYRVTECGIRAKPVSQDMILYSTELHYTSKGTTPTHTIPVSCVAPQRSPWLTPSYTVNVASGGGATAQDDEPSCQVFALSQSNQRASCDCPPCVFSQEKPLYFVDNSEDWCLRSDDLISSL